MVPQRNKEKGTHKNMGKQMSSSTHYYGLDLLRSISAVCILLYHYTYRFCEHEVFSPGRGISWIGFKYGCCAIVTFFLLSGIFAEYDISNNRTVKSFFLRKFFRLYPTFWLSIIITTVCEYLLFPQALVSIKDMLLNLTMIPGILGAKPVDGAYWTLQYEIIFCISIGIIKWFNTKVKRDISSLVFLLWTFISIVLFFATKYTSSGVVSGLVVISLAEYIGCFISGLMIARLLKDNKNVLSWVTLGFALSSSAVWLGKMQLYFLLGSMMISAYVLINKKSLLNRNCRINRIIMYFAGCTYPLYLIHQYVGYSILNYSVMHGFNSEMIIIVPIAIVLIVSITIYCLFENKLIKSVSRKCGV